MANGDNYKTPTWQWIAVSAVGLIISLSLLSLAETRGDIRDVRKANTEVCDRVTILETANKLQFEQIAAWRKEIKDGMREISDKLDANERSIKRVKIGDASK
jgi:hypothetical protein